MKETKRKWDMLTQEQRKVRIQEIIQFFLEERSETIGVIAAEQLLDFFLQTLGEDVYNKAIDDAKDVLQKHIENTETDLDMLMMK